MMNLTGDAGVMLHHERGGTFNQAAISSASLRRAA